MAPQSANTSHITKEFGNFIQQASFQNLNEPKKDNFVVIENQETVAAAPHFPQPDDR